jgi:Zn-dependent peptidase ImmA (M78 family)
MHQIPREVTLYKSYKISKVSKKTNYKKLLHSNNQKSKNKTISIYNNFML